MEMSQSSILKGYTGKSQILSLATENVAKQIKRAAVIFSNTSSGCPARRRFNKCSESAVWYSMPGPPGGVLGCFRKAAENHKGEPYIITTSLLISIQF